MWIILALVSAIGLGFYDIFKKQSVKDNNVPMVLFLAVLIGALLMSPVIITGLARGYYGLGETVYGHLQIVLKSVIVLSSWMLGYFAIKHLPLTIQGPINATRPVMVLLGALIVFGERLNLLQWCGMLLGFSSLYLISRIGNKEGFRFSNSKWLWMSVGATMLGAVSALYDKYLLRMYEPLEVQAWYTLYQMIIMGGIVLFMRKITPSHCGSVFKWRWTIVCIPLFLTGADIAYFYSLAQDGAMISVVSMIRRGSVIISFLYGVMVLREKNVKAKAVDLGILLISLGLLVAGSEL